MARSVLITGELRKWTRTGTGDQEQFDGDMYNDAHGIFDDGHRRTFLHNSIKSVADYGDHLILRTPGWNLKLLKCNELKT